MIATSAKDFTILPHGSVVVADRDGRDAAYGKRGTRWFFAGATGRSDGYDAEQMIRMHPRWIVVWQPT